MQLDLEFPQNVIQFPSSLALQKIFLRPHPHPQKRGSSCAESCCPFNTIVIPLDQRWIPRTLHMLHVTCSIFWLNFFNSSSTHSNSIHSANGLCSSLVYEPIQPYWYVVNQTQGNLPRELEKTKNISRPPNVVSGDLQLVHNFYISRPRSVDAVPSSTRVFLIR